jgi:hypothetical protein
MEGGNGRERRRESSVERDRGGGKGEGGIERGVFMSVAT